MKVIFLDVDGVLNNATPEKMYGSASWPTFDRLNRLKAIVDATGAKIVLASQWRLWPSSYRFLKGFLNRVELNIYDTTLEIDRDKNLEIKQYLDTHNIKGYVILEDTDLNEDLVTHQIKTVMGIGLQDEHVQKAIDILNHE